MSLKVKGITIEIDGNTTGLNKALSDVDSKAGKLQTELKNVDKLLKFNPGNTELVAQKQKLLAEKVSTTSEKLKRLKSAQDDVTAAFKRGDISEAKYREFQREIVQTESKLKHFESQLASTQSKLDRFAQKAGQAGEKFKKAGSAINNAGKNMSMKVTAPIAGIGAAVIKTGMEFEAQMSKVSAISGATGDDFKRLEQQARDLGKNTEWSATNAAEGMEKLALAGWKTNDIIKAMPGMLALASAGNLDLGEAADITSDTMQAFSINADKAGHAADVFAYAQANANTDVSQMGEAMKFAAPIANSYSWSLEETAAAQMALADAGLKGSIAGQAFASSLARLSKPSEKTGRLWEATNSEFFTAEGQLKKLPDLLKEVEKATADMTDEQKAGYLAATFGTEAYKHWAILLERGSDELGRMTGELEKADGAAEKMREEMQNNAKGGVKEMLSALEELGLVIYEKILPAFTPLIKAVTEFAKKMANLPGPVQQAIIIMAALLAAIGPVLIIIGQMAMGMGGLLTAFSKIAPFIGTGSKAFGMLSKILSGLRLAFAGIVPLLTTIGGAIAAISAPVWITIAAIAALIAIGVALWKNWDKVKEVAATLWDGVKEVWSAFVEWAKEFFAMLGAFFVGIWDSIVGGAVSLWDRVKEAWTAYVEWVKAFWAPIIEFFSGIWDAIKNSAAKMWDGVKEIWTTFVDSIKDIFTPLHAFFTDTWSGIKETFKKNLESIKNTMTTVWTSIKDIAKNMWVLIKNAILGPILLVIDVVTGKSNRFKKDLSQIWENIKQAALNIWNSLGDGVKAIVKGFIDAVHNSFGFMQNTLKNLWITIKKVAVAEWNGLKNTVTAVAKGLVSFLTTAHEKAKSVLIGIWKAIKNGAIAAWEGLKKGVKSATKATVDFFVNLWKGAKETFLNLVKGIVDGVTKAWDTIQSKTEVAFKKVVEFIKHPLKTLRLDKIGKDIIRGLINGITSMYDKVKDTVRKIGDMVPKTIRKILGIKSPSRVMIEVGKFIGQGLVKGLDNANKPVDAATARLANRVIDTVVAGHTEINRLNIQANKDAKKREQESRKEILAISQKAKREKRNLTQSEINKMRSIEKKYASDVKKINDKLAKDIVAAEKKKAEQVEKIKQAEFQRSKDYIQYEKDYKGMSLYDELKAWERVSARYQKGTEQRKEADQKALDTKVAINDKLLSLNEDYIKRMDDVNQKYLEDSKKLTEDYNKTVQDRTNALVSFAGIFDEISTKSDVSGEQLMKNLDDQVYAFKNWSSDIRELSKRGLDQGLVEELREMGPKASAEIKALTSLSDKQLQQYAGLWKQKNNLAKNQATSELQGLKEETKKKLTELHQQTEQQLTGLVGDWQKEIAKIRTGTTGEFNALSADMKGIGANAIKSMITGMQGFDGPLKNQVKNISGMIGNTVNQSLSLKAPKAEARKVGKTIGSEIAKGIESMQTAVKQATAKLAEVKVPVTPRVNVAPLEETSRNKDARQSQNSKPVEQKTEINNEIHVAQLVVREEADIQKIAKELYRLQREKERGLGYE